MKKDTLKTLQLYYAGLLSEILSLLDKHRLLSITAIQKQAEDIISAPGRVSQHNLRNPQDVFQSHRRIFGFSDWKVEKGTDAYIVSSSSCKLFKICSAIDAPEPCTICCINPLRALCSALPQPAKLSVNTTLAESSECKFTINNNFNRGL